MFIRYEIIDDITKAIPLAIDDVENKKCKHAVAIETCIAVISNPVIPKRKACLLHSIKKLFLYLIVNVTIVEYLKLL